MTEGMSWPALGEDSVVTTVILDDATTAKRAELRCERENAAIVGAVAWMWWTDGSCSDDGQVGAAAVCKHRDKCRAHCSNLTTGQTEVFDS